MKPPFEMIQETEIEKWRYETFWTKEPETIEWIDSFTGGNFMDIGANIGIYTMYCATKHPAMMIMAFEPFKSNYDRLVENARLNDFQNIKAANVAVGAYHRLCYFDKVSDKVGSSGHQINEKDGDCVCITLNSFKVLTQTPINYIKIDTDGNEYDILCHAKAALEDKELRSVLVEISNHKEAILKIMTGAGFTTDNRFNTMTPHSSERRKNAGAIEENIIFTR